MGPSRLEWGPAAQRWACGPLSAKLTAGVSASNQQQLGSTLTPSVSGFAGATPLGEGGFFYSFACNSRMGLFCRMEAEMAADAPTQRAKWAIT